MWKPELQTDTIEKKWQCVATNKDGSILVAAVKGGNVWVKKNNVWTQNFSTLLSTISLQWSCVASNKEGTILYACDKVNETGDTVNETGNIWSWTNNTWQNITNTDPLVSGKKWTSISCDSSGSVVFACSENNGTSGGDIWCRIDNIWQHIREDYCPPNQNWSSIACDDSADTIIACVNGGNIWIGLRDDTGTAFIEMNIVYQNWSHVAINSTGNFFVACTSGGNIWKGSIVSNKIYWEEINNVQNWRSITMDASGQNIFACAYGNDIWSSNDYGNTWKATMMSYKSWISIASDSTGQNLIACEYGGKLWLNKPDSIPISPISPIPSSPIIDICFVKDTLVETDQGVVPIQNLIPRKHSLFKQYIIAVTKTIHTDAELVKVSAYAFGSYPTKDTYVSKNHKINGMKSFLEAQNYVNGTTITLVPYHREPLYNVLCERPSFMKVHGMMAETLDPQTDIALYHKSKRYRRL